MAAADRRALVRLLLPAQLAGRDVEAVDHELQIAGLPAATRDRAARSFSMICSSLSALPLQFGDVVVAVDAGRRLLEDARADRGGHDHLVAPHDRRRPPAAGDVGLPRDVDRRRPLRRQRRDRETARPDGPRNCGQVAIGRRRRLGNERRDEQQQREEESHGRSLHSRPAVPSFGKNLRLCFTEYRIQIRYLSQRMRAEANPGRRGQHGPATDVPDGALAWPAIDVDEAGDGIDALQIIENRPPDLVVLDLMLRALDGVSVQQELAARAITRAHPDRHRHRLHHHHRQRSNVACVLRKPVMPDELVRTVGVSGRALPPARPASGA